MEPIHVSATCRRQGDTDDGYLAGAYPTFVRSLLDGFSDTQREVVAHAGGPLLVRGAPGTGKTSTLIARFEWLVDHDLPPENVLLLSVSPPAAEDIRTRLEDSLTRGYEELSVLTPPALCARVLAAEALEAGLDPFFVMATRADRVAMLLERIDELTLARHDFRGRPSELMVSFVERIDRLKGELIDAERYVAWAAKQGADAAQEREFAKLYLDHDRMLAERGTPDAGELLIRVCTLLGSSPSVRARVSERYRHVLVDDFQDASFAAVKLIDLLVCEHGEVIVAGDENQAIERSWGAATRNMDEFRARYPEAPVVSLTSGFRSRPRILAAAGAVAQTALSVEYEGPPEEDGEVGFWRCANERTQAQSVAAEIELLIGSQAVSAERIAILVRSVASEGQLVAGALQERAIPYRMLGASAFFERSEVRDVLAWMRLLIDPRDAGAVVRALARPPIELRQVDLARVIQIARRRKLDMISALVGATESPQIPPEARERIHGFLKLYRETVAGLDTMRPDLFVHRLIERIGLRRQQLFAAQAEVVQRLVNLARLGELATSFVRRAPQSTPRELAGYLAAISESGLSFPETTVELMPQTVQVMNMSSTRGCEFDYVYVLGLQSARMPGIHRGEASHGWVPGELLYERAPLGAREDDAARLRRLLYLAMTRTARRLVLAYSATSQDGALQGPSPFVEDARRALGQEWEEREEELFGPAETLHATLRLMREEVLEDVARIGGRLGELRLDTDLDISHGVVRYLELVKLAALLERPAEQSIADALPDLNSRLLAACTSLQREIYGTSTLDETLLAAEHNDRARAQAIAARHEPSLEPFLPRRGEGLVLSASDIETYRSCPLRYKFARVFRIPSESTLHQRFGILVHQVLERYHSSRGETLKQLMDLLDAGWRRAGFSDGEQERQLQKKARAALTRYHGELERQSAEPVWFERSFSFRLGPHHLRGRVDRVDRLPDGTYELIDYKTSRPKSAADLKEDVQLSLYALAAQEAWQLDATQQAYHYVLDSQKVLVPAREEADAGWITATVMEVGEGILAQEFEPTPSHSVCSMCDYRIVCPAAER
ncbi:MAG TPA: ATP-dependent DNA helicase [Solirubrobacteraceae bacterium]|jgi:DNA helicase-2/ATP-dependent DNA helicase PcrA